MSGKGVESPTTDSAYVALEKIHWVAAATTNTLVAGYSEFNSHPDNVLFFFHGVSIFVSSHTPYHFEAAATNNGISLAGGGEGGGYVSYAALAMYVYLCVRKRFYFGVGHHGRKAESAIEV